jgi:hypothetical protein
VQVKASNQNTDLNLGAIERHPLTGSMENFLRRNLLNVHGYNEHRLAGRRWSAKLWFLIVQVASVAGYVGRYCRYNHAQRAAGSSVECESHHHKLASTFTRVLPFQRWVEEYFGGLWSSLVHVNINVVWVETTQEPGETSGWREIKVVIEARNMCTLAGVCGRIHSLIRRLDIGLSTVRTLFAVFQWWLSVSMPVRGVPLAAPSSRGAMPGIQE